MANIGIKSSYLRDAIVQQIVGIPAYEHGGFQPYLALYTSDPTINDTGAEVSGGGYARQPIDLLTAGVTNGTLTNDDAQAFTMPDPTVVTHWGIRDAITGGNLLYFGAFDVPLVLNGSVTVNAGDLLVSED